MNKTEVEALLKRVFKERFRYATGTSHEFILAVPELQSTPEYPYSECCVPVHNGQHVKGIWLRRAYQIAIELDLYPPVSEGQIEEDDNEQDNDEGTVE